MKLTLYLCQYMLKQWSGSGLDFLDALLIFVRGPFSNYMSILHFNFLVFFLLHVLPTACCDIDKESNHVLVQEQVLLLLLHEWMFQLTPAKH